MNKITKRAKMVDVIYTEVLTYKTKYKCPSCYIEYHGSGPIKNVISFKCNCGQELKINKRYLKKFNE